MLNLNELLVVAWFFGEVRRKLVLIGNCLLLILEDHQLWVTAPIAYVVLLFLFLVRAVLSGLDRMMWTLELNLIECVNLNKRLLNGFLCIFSQSVFLILLIPNLQDQQVVFLHDHALKDLPVLKGNFERDLVFSKFDIDLLSLVSIAIFGAFFLFLIVLDELVVLIVPQMIYQ